MVDLDGAVCPESQRKQDQPAALSSGLLRHTSPDIRQLRTVNALARNADAVGILSEVEVGLEHQLEATSAALANVCGVDLGFSVLAREHISLRGSSAAAGSCSGATLSVLRYEASMIRGAPFLQDEQTFSNADQMHAAIADCSDPGDHGVLWLTFTGLVDRSVLSRLTSQFQLHPRSFGPLRYPTPLLTGHTILLSDDASARQQVCFSCTLPTLTDHSGTDKFSGTLTVHKSLPPPLVNAITAKVN